MENKWEPFLQSFQLKYILQLALYMQLKCLINIRSSAHEA